MNNNEKTASSKLVGVKLCDIHKEWCIKVWQWWAPGSEYPKGRMPGLVPKARGYWERGWLSLREDLWDGNALIAENTRECLWRGMISPTFFWSNRCSYHIFLTKIILNNFSLLPAPLHVPYREKDEDDDLEKAYKEVGVCVLCRPCWIFYQRLLAVIDRNI